MRPLRLEVEGFSSYRKRETLDLADVEFFSVSGPTGSGKSSLVDAMIFALYGRVPRLGGNVVAPAITAGAHQARVRFDFEVGGVEHTAVRLAERTKSGATVREARLQRGEEVLASGADDVTKEVTSLLKLNFDEFTRTVVLPQGEFARFLTAKKSERQELLRSLLALDIYGEVRILARARAAVAEDRVQQSRARLETLEVPDDEAVRAAVDRLAALEELRESVVEEEERLRLELEGLGAAREELDRLDDSLARLAAVEGPVRLDELDALAVSARDQTEVAAASLARAGAGEERARAAVEGLPTIETLAGMRRDLTRVAEITQRLEDLDFEGSRKHLATAEAELAQHAAGLAVAEDSLAEARMAHAAHALVSTLTQGEPCPVCEQTVPTIPAPGAPAELTRLETEVGQARTLVTEATSTVGAARARLTECEARRTELESQLEQTRAVLEPGMTLNELDRLDGKVEEARADLEAAIETRKEREEELAARELALEELSEKVRSLGRLLLAARQSVASLDPPIPESEDLLVQWKELLTWVAESAERLALEREEAAARLDEVAAAAETRRRRLVEQLEKAGVPAHQPYAVQVAAHAEMARQTVAAQCQIASEAKRLGSEIESAHSDAAVAGELAGHLGAAGFERWLMAGAISDLVAGANELLEELSKGKYSLGSDDDGSFSIVDHTKAGEVRPVSTLSGGETFLFSLALAMSLAETLSSAGGARLDAIVLDEGFGTLDDEPLDVVASVLEELAAQELVVGVITHVKELAARAPARFEVIADPAGSRVVRVS